ncbi:MAG: group III truncated hemoglobin [Achromobacter sp.]|uniref:group III truncated hemoglobin n=1 Tax=unclassified Achromobacter TaxID=2626865 RepID=UPI000AFAE53B|nr:group III truncated hemoglobin [Achromobacter sp. Root565]
MTTHDIATDTDTADICTEAEIQDLVHTFYAKARADDALGPIFNGMVHDWDEHLATLSDFWSAVILGTRRFTGMPMPKHAAMPNLKAELFERWLVLFNETTDALPNRALADAAQEMAKRMARSLWYGYQLSRDPNQPLTELRSPAHPELHSDLHPEPRIA